jgi:hypothetical protein
LTQPGSSAFPSPAPAGPYGGNFASFLGTNPNGTWQLFVLDPALGDHGAVNGGWSLTLDDGSEVPEPATGVLLGAGLVALALARPYLF